MHPVDEYAFLKNEIRRLENRAKALRAGFLDGGALRGEAHEVFVRRPKRRVFLREKLPHYTLKEPSLWEVRESPVVTVRRVGEFDGLLDIAPPNASIRRQNQRKQHHHANNVNSNA